MMPPSRHAIQAMALIEIDPQLTPFAHEQQKWLTSIELSEGAPKEKDNSKFFAIVPGIYLLLGFCEKNKDPIYEIEFTMKPTAEWTPVKMSENVQSALGAYLCYKNQVNLLSGPICDVDLLTLQRKSRYGQSKQILNVPHLYKLISHQLAFGYLIFKKVKSKIQQSFKAVLHQKYLSEDAGRINLSQLPLFCFPDGIKIVREIRGFLTFSFVFTLETAERIYVTCLVFKEPLTPQKRQKLEVFTNQQLFYEKALCIVSNQCYTDQYGECLQHLYRLSMSKSDIPFWNVVQTLTNSMIMPSPNQIGDVGLSYCYAGNKIDFPTNNKFPFVSERAIYSIFKFMTIENIISVFESLLLERKVFFVSQSKTILGYATQAFLGLLFPFKWEQVLIPILPSNLKEYLTAPVPLVAGITPILVDSSIESDSVIVYLDKNQILNDEDNPPLPEKLLKQLMKRLQKFQIYDPDEVTEFLQNPESTYLFKMQEVQDPSFHGYLVRDSFYQFFLTLMKNYKKYLTKPKQMISQFDNTMNQFSLEQAALMNNIFKLQDFLGDLGMTKIGSFGYKFTESSIFTSFIQRRYQQQNNPELNFFDDCIDRKKNKKQSAFIAPIFNKKYRVIDNPEVNIEDAGPFFYHQFPSLLKEPVIKAEQIQIQIKNEDEEIENKLINTIQQQYILNSNMFEQQQHNDLLLQKMHGLLLNKNKIQLNSTNLQNKKDLFNWFIKVYEKQTVQIEQIFTEWPKIACQQDLKKMKKIQYLRSEKTFGQNQVVGVYQNDNCQILHRRDTKILFIQSNTSTTISKSSSLLIQIPSQTLRLFINTIIQKQAGFIIDYCEKQSIKDMRASSFRKSCEQTWNIQTFIDFRNWLQCEKQFATGITHE